MRVLLDTHLLLWAAGDSRRLSADARGLIGDSANELIFSAASLWEIVIKRALGRSDFRVDPGVLRRGMIENGYVELPIAGAHTLAVETMPPIHTDPFDRILVAQATVEGITLLTSDAIVARYPGPVRRV
ncbi:MAG TPA: type II toxin-antitoxin system VapC family toxin [Casimicrobiaceae bacterium]|nr:type II toxin-antitoxin system VapC family toxin [Casimicrobiaceae bacterium]